MGQEEPANVKEFGIVDKDLDLRFLQVVGGELFGGGQGRYQGSAGAGSLLSALFSFFFSMTFSSPIVAGNDNGASSGLFVGMNLVSGFNPFLRNICKDV